MPVLQGSSIGVLFVFVRWSLVFSLSWFICLSQAHVVAGIVVLNYDPLPQTFRRQPQVPNTNRPLPIPCPKCHHDGSRLVVRSLTVMSLTCANCGHFWATDLESLPPEIQKKVPDALRDP